MDSVPRFAALCVDDDEDSRVMLGALLSFLDIEVKAVGSATQALGLINSERFDLYLLDALLPEIDGFELCRRLRVFDPFKPILFFSGAAYETDKQKGIQAGATGYVVKPDIRKLLESITQLLPIKSPESFGDIHEEGFDCSVTPSQFRLHGADRILTGEASKAQAKLLEETPR